MAERPLLTEAMNLYTDYYLRIRDMRPDFADDLLREALRCYATEAHTAVCVVCRVAVEEELKEIHELLVTLSDHSTWQPVERMQLESLKEWAHALRIINGKQTVTIEKIQGRGNRSAHGPTADIWKQLRRRKTQKDLAQPLEIWADQQDARSQIQAAAQVLRQLKAKKDQINRLRRIP